MAETYSVFTVNREDLVVLARNIARAIPEDFLKDREKPVVIEVNGTYGCGKKIFADYGRAALLEDAKNDDKPFNEHRYSVAGREEYDEYANGIKNGRRLSVTFINLAFSDYNYSFDITKGLWSDFLYFFSGKYRNKQVYRQHQACRKNGGISYIHNNTVRAIDPDIEIWLEGDNGSVVGSLSRRCKEVGKAIRSVHSDDIHDIDILNWERYVEVKINNEALCQLSRLPQMLRDEMGFVAREDMDKSFYRKYDVIGDVERIIAKISHKDMPKPHVAPILRR